MGQYIARRLIFAVPTIFLVTLLVFSAVRMIPGDAVMVMLGDANVSSADITEMRTRLGLDQPIWQQYARWIGEMTRGDLGNSLFSRQPVFQEIVVQRLPVTLELMGLSILISLLIGLPVGILSAVRQDTARDYISRSAAILGLSVPYFWTATLIILYGSIWFGWMPPVHYVDLTEDPIQHLSQLAIPALLLGVYMAAIVMRMSRTTLLEVLRQDYIRTAWAKGLRERLVIVRHALRNAMAPVVTIVGVNIVLGLSGTVILEQIFVIPGIGSYIISAVLWRDYPAIQAVNLFMAIPVVGINLLVDVAVAYLDPRIRYR
ncbi:MAG: ABC transporter permease [Dehalococcoidia bacterium]|nr:ABC transporter permease [Dehalococcoidia bacterium]